LIDLIETFCELDHMQCLGDMGSTLKTAANLCRIRHHPAALEVAPAMKLRSLAASKNW
jgi:hypothetical protein